MEICSERDFWMVERSIQKSRFLRGDRKRCPRGVTATCARAAKNKLTGVGCGETLWDASGQSYLIQPSAARQLRKVNWWRANLLISGKRGASGCPATSNVWEAFLHDAS